MGYSSKVQSQLGKIAGVIVYEALAALIQYDSFIKFGLHLPESGYHVFGLFKEIVVILFFETHLF